MTRVGASSTNENVLHLVKWKNKETDMICIITLFIQ